MSTRPFFPFYYADYLGDTSQLTTLEHGAYMLLLLSYYARRQPLDDDERSLAQIARMEPRAWRKISQTVLAYFELSNGRWHNQKADKILGIKTARSEAGIAGNTKRWGVANGIANTSQEASQTDRSIFHTPDKNPLTPSDEGEPASQNGRGERPSRANGTNPRALEAQTMDALEQAKADARAAKWRDRLIEYSSTGRWPGFWGRKPSMNKAVKEPGVFLPTSLHDDFREIEARIRS